MGEGGKVEGRSWGMGAMVRIRVDNVKGSRALEVRDGIEAGERE